MCVCVRVYICVTGQRVGAVQVNLTPLISRDALATDASSMQFSLLVNSPDFHAGDLGSTPAGERDPLQIYKYIYIYIYIQYFLCVL